ncbi:hypothetical protein [Mesorhizobium sp. ANAO-SY3R2]|uniref:hypothetical protein n=1 Tax=Mesorhizobium sp. ANAO-SY3R2 TaxID=3166644 RepID=UPI003672AADB
MKIDRWNGGVLRRYHHPSGAILVTHRNYYTGKKSACVIPAFCRHADADMPRDSAASILRAWRAEIAA